MAKKKEKDEGDRDGRDLGLPEVLLHPVDVVPAEVVPVVGLVGADLCEFLEDLVSAVVSHRLD